jgi:hypothetical protein
MTRWLQALVPLLLVGGTLAAVFYFRDMSPSSGMDVYGHPEVDRKRACTKLAGEPDDRIATCMVQLGVSTLSKPATDMLVDITDDGTKTLMLARVEQEVPGAVSLDEVQDARTALMGRDEAAAAKLLREGGVRGVLVNRDFVGALDRDSRVFARLAYHDHLEWFQLRYVTDDLLMYTVRKQPTRVPLKTGDGLLKALRGRLTGGPIPKVAWNPDVVRLMGTMRLQGNMLVIRHAVGNNLDKVLDDLAASMMRSWERDAVPDGHGDLADRLNDIRIEVHVVMERAPVEPRSRFAIFELWDQGIDGMMFKQRPGVDPDKFTYMPGSELTTHSMRSADEFLRFSVGQFGWNDPRPWEKDMRTQLSVIRTQHFMEERRGGGPAVRLIRGLPEVTMAEMTDRHIQQMLISGGEWWLHNFEDDDRFEYKYWPTQNRSSDDYNEVRHILGARDLADTWRFRQDDRYLKGSHRAMDWLMRYAIDNTDPPDAQLPHPGEGQMLFRYPSRKDAKQIGKEPNQKLGTVAVGLLGWIAWAQATGSHAEDERIRRMARFTEAQMEPNGKFRAYYVHKGHAYEHEKNDIVPGEAALALGMVAEYFEEPEWVAGFPKFLDFYMPWFRERAVRKQPHGRWPHDTYTNQDRLDLVQFGPWSVMASKQYYQLTGDERAAEFGLEVADWMIDNYQWSGELSPWPDYVGGYYKLPQETPAMQTFCYSEGTAAAYTIASRFAPDRKAKYELSTKEALRFAELMQFDDVDSYYVAHPEKIRGGIKYTMTENKVRTDYVGHGMSTMSQWLDARDFDPAVELDVEDPAARATWGPYESRPEPTAEAADEAGAEAG